MATPDKRPPAWAETSVAAPMEITAETILAEFRSTKGPTPEFQGELQSRIVTAVLLNQEAESLELRAATELLLDVTIPKRVHVRLLNLGGGVGDVLVRSRLSPDGPTVVHNAAYHGYLDHIPNLNVELLLMPEGRRAMSAPVMVAAGKRHLDQIPANLFTPELLSPPGRETGQNTPVHEAATHGSLNQIPPEMLTEELLSAPASNGSTIVHLAAMSGYIEQVPLTPRLLALQNDDGGTPLHYAAFMKCLNRIPKQLLTKELLSMTDNRGSTPVHMAAMSGVLGDLPAEFAIKELLLAADKKGDTPIHIAAEKSYLFQLPSAFCTQELLSTPNQHGATPQSISNLKDLFPSAAYENSR